MEETHMMDGSRRSCILLADDDSDITAGLAVTLERAGRTTILCSDIQSAEIALETYPVTHLVCDVQFTGDFGFEGLHFLGRARQLVPDCRVVLMTGYATDALRSAAARFGAATLLAKPFDTEELELALAPIVSDDREPYEVIRIPPLDELLVGDDLYPMFQPIVRVTQEGTHPYGFEALARSRGSWMLRGPAMLFDYAERCSRLGELNRKLVALSIKHASLLPSETLLFLNVDPAAFDEKLLPRTIEQACDASGVPFSRLVLEVTERSAFANEESVARICESMRRRGVRFALDDHGSAYSHLGVMTRIKPSFFKISNAFGTSFEQDSAKERIVRHIAGLARDFSCETILEGIETESTARAVPGVGIQLAQGYHFGRPNVATYWSAATDAA
jgi:EAL domain-containing protein (putative c-di-GMP-specific phosphodiesterase class I)